MERPMLAPVLGVRFADHQWGPSASPGQVAVNESGHAEGAHDDSSND
jgi:hypothetical protein